MVTEGEIGRQCERGQRHIAAQAIVDEWVAKLTDIYIEASRPSHDG